MPCEVLVGGQWGDEGKAKVIDFLSSNFDYIVRFQGGANAGHTVIKDGKKLIFHLIPSGVLYPKKIGVLGNGMVIDPEQVIIEKELLKESNVDVEDRLFISENAHVVMDYHKLLDELKETKGKSNKIGTTRRGIGPCYSDKANRVGIRFADLLFDNLLDKISASLEMKNFVFKNYFSAEPIEPKYLFDKYRAFGEKLRKHVTNTVVMLNKALDSNKMVLCEGAQALGLDIDFGTYPYVTSSNCSSGGACTGTGISPVKINKVIGVMKAYITRVGEGVFATELEDEYGQMLRDVGNEYGSTTGRPRRCGWFDVVQAKHSIIVNGISELAITKLDVLDNFDEIHVCTDYEIDGQTTSSFPLNYNQLTKVKPVYKKVDGWKSKISDARKFSDLPTNARAYIDLLSELLDVKISYISVGSSREETIRT